MLRNIYCFILQMSIKIELLALLMKRLDRLLIFFVDTLLKRSLFNHGQLLFHCRRIFKFSSTSSHRTSGSIWT